MMTAAAEPSLRLPRSGSRVEVVLAERDAGDLSRLFRVFANPLRLRILHALTLVDEMSVGELAGVAEMSAQATSNQLQRLVDQGFLISRRDGVRVLYRIADPCVPRMLDLGLCLIDEAAGKAERR
jgi:ArsR family transcriptional regulator, lead/cadmium/zinc/bismuth-responsive transcriptional repressor